MRRRSVIKGIAGTAIAWPLLARAQQLPVPVVGVLGAASSDEQAPYTMEFVRGLNETGFVEGRNVAIEYHWAEGHYDRLPALAAELVRKEIAVILASGGQPSIRAAAAATVQFRSCSLSPLIRWLRGMWQVSIDLAAISPE